MVYLFKTSKPIDLESREEKLLPNPMYFFKTALREALFNVAKYVFMI